MGAILLAGYRFSFLEKEEIRETGGKPTMPLGFWPGVAAAGAFIGLIALTANFDMRLARDTIPSTDYIAIAVAMALCVIATWGIVISLIRVYRNGCLKDAMTTTTQITSMVFIILIGAALFSLVFRGLGGDETVQSFLTSMPGGVFGAMLVVMVIMFILGFFLDFIEITFVVVPLVAPALMQMGVDPVWLGVMMAINLQTSFLTPPFGFALFYLRGVAPPSVRTIDIYRGRIAVCRLTDHRTVHHCLLPRHRHLAAEHAVRLN